MLFLILGLLLFLLPHSSKIIAPHWRQEKIAALGELKYAGIYSVVSLVGFLLIVWGYGESRNNPSFIWNPPTAMYHIASLLVLISLILLAAAYIPKNHIKSRVGHPMLLAVKVWAFAHLLVNGRLGDVILFGTFLIWAIVLFITLRRQDRANSTVPVAAQSSATLVVVVTGVVLWLVFALWLHVRLIGVAPFASA